MYHFYNNAPQPAHHYPHPQIMNAAPYPSPAPHAHVVPHDHSSLTFDDTTSKIYADSDRKLWSAFSRAPFPNPDARQQCENFLQRLRIHRHLFMHTFVHLVSCCHGRDLHLLVGKANVWKGWGSVQQLTHHSFIRGELISLGTKYPCRQHQSLFAHVISEDDSDLLCHLLYCRRKSELYDLPRGRGSGPRESEQVVELIWEFLGKRQDIEVVRRLRAQIYRMARKSGYLPHDLQIERPSIHSEQELGAGAKGMVTRAIMNGRHVVIKTISSKDSATRRQCLEMFASEAILWKTLNHENIVPFLGVVMKDTFDIGLVSQFFKNGNIRDYMRTRNPHNWPTLARTWARDLAKGLDYIHCHEPPIIHGDLKGDNVLVDDAGHARLGDFGQSHASDSGKYLDSTRVGLVTSSPVHWMAPEIITGGDHAKASDKSDMYSFGCVLYEMMSGRTPFGDRPFGDVVRLVKDGQRPQRPSSISMDDTLWKTAERCWARRPEDRPSAKSLVSRLH